MHIFQFTLLFLFALTSFSCSQDLAKKNIPATEKAAKVIAAAKSQIGKTVYYDPAYVKLDYPNGDISLERGVCTDVVIRALRKSIQFDLQKQVHRDMKAYFSEYPKIWGLSRADKNIDHRRVPNLQTYFRRTGWALKISDKGSDYKPGDLVTAMYPGNRPHILIVSDVLDGEGNPKVIHNSGGGTRENAMLFSFPITGHYRIR